MLGRVLHKFEEPLSLGLITHATISAEQCNTLNAQVASADGSPIDSFDRCVPLLGQVEQHGQGQLECTSNLLQPR
ncbi:MULTISPECIES: hypothetical protein [unclassified Methylobacterium]|uniref:hypothetical protein n=1 Tax=unclassified Methylobacterium TaxID=2615210 RepID=UPI001FB9949B|nr:MULTISPECIES: hypothetical protein [unclassified Methylobacterium]MCJ2019034.1 hypothetical protein [Methylobacterium sp. E-065]